MAKWIDYRRELMKLDPENCVFVDETGCLLNMSRLYGRSPIGERACSDRPANKGKRISLIGALGFEGLLDCFCFEGTMNGSVFAYYIEHFLVKDLRPGMTVVFDNASPHKDEDALELIENAGAEILLLPPYRPELNPIEYCWSKMKSFLSKFKARTKEALYEGYSLAIELIDSEMARACFRHCRAFKP